MSSLSEIKEQLRYEIEISKEELKQLRLSLGIDINEPIPSSQPLTTPSIQTIKPPINPTTNKPIKPRRASTTNISTSNNITNDLTGQTNSNVDSNTNNKEKKLPDGWKEMVDKRNGKSYYVNTATKEKQWKRPSINTTINNTNNNTNSSDNISNKQIKKQLSNRKSRKVSSNKQTSKKVLTIEEKVTAARQLIASFIDEPPLSGKAIVLMDSIGVTRKTGYLMKQSKLLGRWLKRYIVLSGDSLEYYHDINLSNGKEVLLTSDTTISYSSKDNCFDVRGLIQVDGSPAEDWHLMGIEDSDLDDWLLSISSHIHVLYKKTNNITSDYWEDGPIEISFWKVPESTDEIKRSPIGIRSLPFVNAPKTNDGVYPGETVEIVQTIQRDNNIFLRLADDKGWIFQYHPKDNYSLIEKLNGKIIEEEREYVYSPDEEYSLDVYTGPCIESDFSDYISIPPGSRLFVDIIWTIDEVTFLKLAVERAWICLSDKINRVK